MLDRSSHPTIDKDAKRRAILSAAAEQLKQVGFDAFTMAALGRSAGVAKGTLYLYFRTREEVMLALFLDASAKWQRALTDMIGPGAEDDFVIEAMVRLTEGVPLFLPLLARLGTDIAGNLPDDMQPRPTQELTVLANNLGAHLAVCLTLRMGLARPLAQALVVAMQGAAQTKDFRAALTPAAGLILRGMRQTSSGSRPSRVASGATVSP